MASTTVSSSTTLLLILVSVAVSSGKNTGELRRGLISFTPKTHVKITNKLEEGNLLTIRCLGEGDQQFHQIEVGVTYEFTFHPDLFGGTKVACDLGWDKGFSNFEAYNQSRDKKRCGKVCEWIATKGQVEGFTSDGTGDIVYGWQDPFPGVPPAKIH